MRQAGAKKVIEVTTINMNEARFNIIGEHMIMNRFSQKAWQELLFPSGRKSVAALEQSLKHDPLNEYRGAMYRNRDQSAKTLVHVPNGAFHGAIASAARDIPGAAKAKIERLTRIADVNIELYGVPEIFCAMVRNSDMNHTPDVRTRPVFREWACSIRVVYMAEVLTERTIAALLGGAGQIIGIGDWRGEKGGPYGSFKIVDENDATFKRIIKTGARAAQQAAYDKPAYYNEDTEELLTWFEAQVILRERELPSAEGKPNGRRKPGSGRKPPRGTKVYLEDRNRNLLNG